jgi:hypothetical protein
MSGEDKVINLLSEEDIDLLSEDLEEGVEPNPGSAHATEGTRL